MSSRKDLIKEYKQKKFNAGVFQIRNTLNGKVYIDHSVNLDAIYNRHRTELNFGSHRNRALQQDWKEFGEDGFVFEVLSELKQEDDGLQDVPKELKQLESMFFEELAPYGDKGYHQQK